jgi:DNA-binding NtrC family response regulator
MVPPLRQRKGDIPRFVARAIAEVAAELGAALQPHPRLIETCCLRQWPGNVPELVRAVIDAGRAAHDAGRDPVRPDDLPGGAGVILGDDASTTSTTTGPRPKVSPAEVDRTAVEAALSASSGNVSAAARALGLHRTQLYRLLQRYGLDRTGE